MKRILWWVCYELTHYWPSDVIWRQTSWSPLVWRHNGRDSVSNHQPHDCFLNRLFRHRSKKASLAFMQGIHRGLVNSRHKWPITRKMFPFDDVIMTIGADNDTKPLPAPALNWKLTNIFQWNLNRKYNNYLSGICIWKHRPQNGVHFVQTSKCYVTKRRMVFNLSHSDKVLLTD